MATTSNRDESRFNKFCSEKEKMEVEEDRASYHPSNIKGYNPYVKINHPKYATSTRPVTSNRPAFNHYRA